MKPTRLPDLLSNDLYKAFFKKNPRPYASSTFQFAIVAVSHEGKYGKILRPTFKDAWEKTQLLLEDDRIHDVSMFARNKIVTPPPFASELMKPAEDWCGRCRRPSLFRIYDRYHPALRDAPVIVEYVRRCYFCGISWDYLMQHERKAS